MREIEKILLDARAEVWGKDTMLSGRRKRIAIHIEEALCGLETWTGAWPTETGWYWFYGYRFGKQKEQEKPELSAVEVRHDSQGKSMYITRGHFLYKAERAEGVWCKCILPKLPKKER